jgi:hypothetical protein
LNKITPLSQPWKLLFFPHYIEDLAFCIMV